VLDSLCFIKESLDSSLAHAIKSRGGVTQICRRVAGASHDFAIRVELEIEGDRIEYEFEIGVEGRGGFVVKQESLTSRAASYRVVQGHVVRALSGSAPPAAPDRLYLAIVAGLPELRGVHEQLVSMGFYNLNPEKMKQPQINDAGQLLHRDGRNIASVFAGLARDRPPTLDRIVRYLGAIIPNVTAVTHASLGAWETLELWQKIEGVEDPLRFYLASTSDGTLRALGALVAVAQRSDTGAPMSLVGVEEPETTLHPVGVGALMKAFREAAAHTQIIITSHSPDLVDRIVDDDRLLVAQSIQGLTFVGVVDRASRDAIETRLYTPGDLLRMDQLCVDRDDLARQQSLTVLGGYRG